MEVIPNGPSDDIQHTDASTTDAVVIRSSDTDQPNTSLAAREEDGILAEINVVRDRTLQRFVQLTTTFECHRSEANDTRTDIFHRLRPSPSDESIDNPDVPDVPTGHSV